MRIARHRRAAGDRRQRHIRRRVGDRGDADPHPRRLCLERVCARRQMAARAADRRRNFGRTLGLIGFGSIARETASRARALGMRIIATDPFVGPEAPAWTKHDVERVDLDTLLASADAVSLHVPLNAETRNLIDTRRLQQMNPGAILLNAARGGVVDEAALAAALKAGRIKGAALDVFAEEPLRAGSPLADAPNLIVTPHIAGVTGESNMRVSAVTGRNVRRMLNRKAEVMAHVLSIAEAQARVASVFV